MQKKIKWLIPILIGAQLTTHAQLSDIYSNKNYQINTAKELYNNEVYQGTQYILNNLINYQQLEPNQLEIAEFYNALISLILQDEGALNQYEAFNYKYPESALSEESHLHLGNYYLYNQEYQKAADELSLVNIESLSSNQRANQYIKLGYAQFMIQEFDNAKKNLEKGLANTQYKDQVSYLLGHIEYSNGNYENAKNQFLNIKDNPEFSDKIKPYMVQIYFNEGAYDHAINEGKNLLETNKNQELKIEISKIIGESYFRKKQYKEASPYLLTYIQKTKEPSSIDYYQMGYVFYHSQNYEEAVNYFNKIIAGDSSAVSQNAYYQLGNSYLKINKKKEALTAFKSASEMSFDKQIQENAYLNYAKLSYEIGNPYTSTSKVLSDYLKLYPSSKYKEEINQLLIKSYINSGNFAEASELLNQINNKSPELLLIEQEVAYAYGIQLYNQRKITEAAEQFEKAKKLKNQTNLYALSLYWNADCQYQLGNYQAAIDDLETLRNTNIQTSENQQIWYQEGYAYLKLQQFDKANLAFQNYLKNPKPEFKQDAELRLADAQLGNNNLDDALNSYTKFSTEGNTEGEYSQYQKAVIYGLKNDHKNKIIELEKFIKSYPKSDKIIDAYFELGQAYSETEDFKNSNYYFQKVIDYSKNNDLVAMAYLNKADNTYSLKDYQQAINQYGYIADQYPKTDYALQAVNAAKSAFLEGGRIKEYEKWMNKKGYSLDQADAEDLAFTVAEKEYLNKSYKNSAEDFSNFLNKYPNTNRKITSQYYLGDSYFKTEKYSDAITPLKSVASTSNEYQEDALAKLAQIYLKQEQDSEAKTALEALRNITQNPEYLSFSALELMYIYSDNKEYKKANEMAEKVITNNKNPDNVKEQANLIIARSLYETGKIKEAQNLFSKLEKSNNNTVKAEALYYKALFKNKDKKYEASNTIIFDLTSKYSDQQYWGAKSLLIMSDNYSKLKDTYQATYILNQIIDNYKEFPDVTNEAENMLSKIKNN